MKPGTYKTKAGSTVVIAGEHGRSEVIFDWLEEQSHDVDACIDCDPVVYDRWLIWDCEHCGGGEAELHLDVVTIEIPREDQIAGLQTLRSLRNFWYRSAGDQRVVEPDKSVSALDALIHAIEEA